MPKLFFKKDAKYCVSTWEYIRGCILETQSIASLRRMYLEVRFKHIFIVKAENMFGSLFGSVH